MDLLNPKTAAARLKKISRLRPTLAIVLGSRFHHVLTELRVPSIVARESARRESFCRGQS
jgi:hypothetical protein